MPRGLGRTQRAILETMWIAARRQRTPTREHWNVDRLAWRFSQKQTARARADARARVKRACRRLVKDGLILRVGIAWTLPPETKLEAFVRRKRNHDMGTPRQQEAREAKRTAEAAAWEYQRREKIQQQAKQEIAKATRTKIAKILGMLGSDHDGEVLGAARQVERLRTELGCTWADLLIT